MHFGANKSNEKIYLQVTESMNDETIRERELSPLTKIKDNYEKIVLSLDETEDVIDGIKVINLINWLIK